MLKFKGPLNKIIAGATTNLGHVAKLRYVWDRITGQTINVRPEPKLTSTVRLFLDLRHRLTRFLATFIAAWFSLKLLQAKKPTLRRRAGSGTIRYIDPETGKKLAGRTVDLTLFAATQAIDVIVGEVWARHKARRQTAQKWTKVRALSESQLTLCSLNFYATSCIRSLAASTTAVVHGPA